MKIAPANILTGWKVLFQPPHPLTLTTARIVEERQHPLFFTNASAPIIQTNFRESGCVEMAEYICRLGTPAGEIVTRTVEGMSEQELRQRLTQEGYRIFSVENSGSFGGVRTGGVRQRSRKIKLDDFLLFNQQLAALFHAGLPVLQSIQMLRQRSPNPKLRLVLADVEARIKSGSALSEAFEAQGETFPKIYTASILAGERSGNLDDVLRRYVEYTKAMAQLRRKIRGALTYPVILLCAAFLLISVLTTFVIPQFTSLYENMGSDLPAVTTFVVGISAGVRENIYWLAPVVLGLVFGVV